MIEDDKEYTYMYTRNGVVFYTPSEEIAMLRCDDKGYQPVLIYNS